jgi:hypothetical protein
LEAHLVDGLPGDERQDPMRAREDLDRRRELVALDLGHRSGEPVPNAGGDDLRALATLGEQAGHLGGSDGALATRRTGRAELPLVFPAPQRLHADAEHRGRLTDPVRRVRHAGGV